MSNVTVTNNNVAGLVVRDPQFRKETLTATGAVVWAMGTVLGRVTTGGKLTAYTAGASNGSQVPKFVTTSEITFTGAGDQRDTVLVGGVVRQGDLVAHGVGALTSLEVDALRDYGIVAEPVAQLNILDNQ